MFCNDGFFGVVVRNFCKAICVVCIAFSALSALALPNPDPINIDPKFSIDWYGVSSTPEGAADLWWPERLREVYNSGRDISDCTGYFIDIHYFNYYDHVFAGAVTANKNTRCAGGIWWIRDDSTYICPQGYLFGYYPKPYCYAEYVAILPHSVPPPYECVGNPVESSTGKKYQVEVDYDAAGRGQVSMARYYSNVNMPGDSLWHHTYNKYLTVFTPSSTSGIKQKSSTFTSQYDACIYGWDNLKSNIPDDWARGSVANFKDGKCQILHGETVVKILPIVSIEQLMSPSAVQLHRPNGSTIEYQDLGDGEYGSTTANQGILRRVNSGDVMWRYYSIDGDVESYSNDGKLLSIIASNGVGQTLTYDPITNLLTQVRDSLGGVLGFSYVGNLLSTVSSNNKTVSYSYNALGLLKAVLRSDDHSRIYHYEDSRFPSYLTGITDELGMRFATWGYDDQGRAISSEHAGGVEKTTLTFNSDGSTKVTNALGKSTIYHFADIVGARRVTAVEGQQTASCLGANKGYTYTSEGWLASKTDWKSNKTTYQYNTKGQEISRTEADGSSVAKTITTEWHPTLNLKTKITEPHRETTYTYDDNGLLTNKNVRSLP